MSSGLCASSFGWPTIFYMIGIFFNLRSYDFFYLSGVFGFIWMVVWVLAVNKTPLKSRWMTQEELDYLNAHINREKKTKHHVRLKFHLKFSHKMFSKPLGQIFFVAKCSMYWPIVQSWAP